MSRDVLLSEGDILDLDAVMSVMNDSFDPAYGEAWTAAQCAGLLPLPAVWLSLARVGGEVVGFGLARIILDEAELLLLAVKRSGQRRGIGQLLLDRFDRIATRRGAGRLHLEVREGNHAVKLYSKAGFREVGRRMNYYRGRDGQIYDALTLAKNIRE
ncbi:MAG TPA: ribosomal protein S18-alanine N-acetyltransferase [Allosphingosinicella sp.]|nr:ribosomal protein S18-alanine N-acetyltransferase [Allosphingosinicella sp.]